MKCFAGIGPAVLIGLAVAGCTRGEGDPSNNGNNNRRIVGDIEYYTVEKTEYKRPQPKVIVNLTDDRLADKTPAFDESLVDSRPLVSEWDDSKWEVNQSAAVIELDCPMVKPDREGWLLELRPSYADAVRAAGERHVTLLPSANLVDGAGKQFDDGLYAAVDRACYRGELGLGVSPPDWTAAVLERLPESSPARPFLAAALELAGRPVELPPEAAAEKKSLLADFEANEVFSKPISFYNWTPELQEVWRFFRFLQQPFDAQHLAAPRDVAGVLEEDAELLDQYRQIVAFYSRLTNPAICLPVDALIGTDADLDRLAEERGVRLAKVAILPPSTSREAELFDRLFPLGVPEGANLMVEMIRRIRSGEVDLAPDADDGWYQHQVHALETLLLPGEGRENEKLLLTAAYKKRLVEAFKALMTKRRETHARQLAPAEGAEEAAPPSQVYPRLRVEPCATFYLRTARAYGFLENFLTATAGEGRLAEMHGLRAGGQREASLADELAGMRTRFYGLYLVACEDIGLRPELADDEPVDAASAKETALAWLAAIADDPDLARDTRVSVPVYVNLLTGRTRLWATLGVRLTWLEASYARAPKIRVLGEDGPWREVESYELAPSRYVIAVDEFAEFERTGFSTLTREEVRRLCDEHKTREEIVAALSR